MNEYRVDIKVRNNIILKKIEEAGFATVGEFCKGNEINHNQYGQILEFVNMKRSPLDNDGNFRKVIIDLALTLKCNPEDLFTESQLYAAIESNKRTIEVKEAELKFIANAPPQKLVEQIVHEDRLEQTIDELLETITPREKKVLEMRFGLNGKETMTFDQVASALGVTRERIRQIELKALRKLRHPSRSEMVRDYIDIDE